MDKVTSINTFINTFWCNLWTQSGYSESSLITGSGLSFEKTCCYANCNNRDQVLPVIKLTGTLSPTLTMVRYCTLLFREIFKTNCRAECDNISNCLPSNFAWWPDLIWQCSDCCFDHQAIVEWGNTSYSDGIYNHIPVQQQGQNEVMYISVQCCNWSMKRERSSHFFAWLVILLLLSSIWSVEIRQSACTHCALI